MHIKMLGETLLNLGKLNMKSVKEQTIAAPRKVQGIQNHFFLMY